MTQNIYDDPDFLSGYRLLRRSVDGLDGAPEWPTLRALLPHLTGARVVDLGCGFGWFCRWAGAEGTDSVLGLDVSVQMLEQAEADGARPRIEYRREDLEALALPEHAFDLAYSSLTLHYISDLPRLLRSVHTALAPYGVFVFSVEHPIFSAPADPAFIERADGSRSWPVDDYLAEGPRSRRWFVDGVIKHHRTIGTYVNELVAAGFVIDHVEEWGPTADQIAANPEWADERHRPPFLLVRATRA